MVRAEKCGSCVARVGSGSGSRQRAPGSGYLGLRCEQCAVNCGQAVGKIVGHVTRGRNLVGSRESWQRPSDEKGNYDDMQPPPWR